MCQSSWAAFCNSSMTVFFTTCSTTLNRPRNRLPNRDRRLNEVFSRSAPGRQAAHGIPRYPIFRFFLFERRVRHLPGSARLYPGDDRHYLLCRLSLGSCADGSVGLPIGPLRAPKDFDAVSRTDDYLQWHLYLSQRVGFHPP